MTRSATSLSLNYGQDQHAAMNGRRLRLLPGFNIRYGRPEATDAEAAPSVACTDAHPYACVVMYAVRKYMSLLFLV